MLGYLGLTERVSYYCGLLMGCKHNPKINADVKIEDLKLIQELISAEEQGLLLRLPCKVGDTLYRIDTDENTEKIEAYTIENIDILKDGDVIFKYDNYDGVICHLENIITDKPYLDFYRIFLTREQAEAWLILKGKFSAKKAIDVLDACKERNRSSGLGR